MAGRDPEREAMPPQRRPRRGWLAAVLGSVFALGGPGAVWAVDVELQMPEAVLTTLPTKVVVTLTPSPSPEPVRLVLRSIQGVGTAVFLPGRQAEVTLSETTTLELLGTQPSEWPQRVLLAATAGGTVLASRLLSVVDPRMLTREQVIARAREVLKVDLDAFQGQGPSSIDVRLVGSEYFVTIGFMHARDPKAMAYTGRIKLDVFTGAVKQIGGREETYY